MLYFLLSSLSFTARNLVNKEYTRRFDSNKSNLFFNTIGLTVTAVICALIGGLETPSALLLLLATLFGICFIATVYFLIVSYAKGPLGLVQLVYGMSSVVPICVGVFMFNEPMSWIKGLGLLCVLGVILLSWRDKEAKNSKSVYIPAKVWLPVTLLTTLLNGLLSAIQKMMVQWCPGTSTNVFNFWAFSIGALFGWIILLILHLRGKRYDDVAKNPKAFTLIALGCGLFSSGGNILIMYALLTIPASVCNPALSTLNTIIIYLISLFYYKEGHSKYGFLMIGMGILSIFLLALG